MSTKSKKSAWFKVWFNSKYYHLLYNHRNDDEAKAFMQELNVLIGFSGKKILDLACGRGRHARMMHSLGADVTGVDLSEESIAESRKGATDNLQFQVGDMRYLEDLPNFDTICSLFTSFGYFAQDEDNLQMLRSVKAHLKNEGHFVLDFLNPRMVEKKLVDYEVIQRKEGALKVDFHVRKRIENGRVFKNIQFENDGENYEYEEQVRLIDLTLFQEWMGAVGFSIIHTFGDYQLNLFEIENSPRLILICK